MSLYPRVKVRWIPEGEGTGMEPEKYRGIMVTDTAALYRLESGNAALGIVEPIADEPGTYRVVGADLPLLNTMPLTKLARYLVDMPALHLLIKLVTRLDCPEELPIP
ncbi:hypothetical protein [Paenibacillus tengchongensis]|uniref:hypothetical protein n=1 Tax=Paenibacillus tengchongensis TaxID=2608684 RepID=UPI00124EDC0D|nr:hypothetical protein [Paenibacillus tengchongensis]